MGANYLGGLFAPDYHAFTNKKRFSMYVDSVSPESRLMIGGNISREMIDEYVHRDYETLYFRDVLDMDFDIADGRILSNCRTVSVLLAGVAVVVGARRIFIAGMDGYLLEKDLKSALFYNETYDPVGEDLNIRRHYENERFLKQVDEYVKANGLEGIHIITRANHQSFYKGFENYL